MNVSAHAPVLIIVLPLMASILNVLIGLWRKNLCHLFVTAVLGTCLLLSLDIMYTVMCSGTIRYRIGGWTPPWGIEYVIDHLNAFVAVIVSTMSFIVCIYSKRSIQKELSPEKIPYFYTIYTLLATGLLGITVAGDVFNIYVFLEITSLAGYALIAIGDSRAPVASFNYVIMGTIGACFYLLGVGYLYIMTGSLNITDLTLLLPGLYGSKVIMVAFTFFMAGVAIKIAFFPLHTWLPNAYTHAPSPVSAVAASTMTKVGAYVMIRISFTVFEPRFSSDIVPMTSVLGWSSVAAIVCGSVLALAQTDFKRMLSYVLIAEVGYIVMGLSVGNRDGFTGSVLHILNDSFMVACLFMVAGAVVYKKGSRTIDDFIGMNAAMPVTMAAFTVASISMIGVPPTAGFFSKWYLVLGAVNAGQWVFAGTLLFSSLMNAVIFVRILEKVYLKGRGSSDVQKGDVPLSMLTPIVFTAAGILVLGFYSGSIISSIIQYTVPKGF